jgi:hypothetical protein
MKEIDYIDALKDEHRELASHAGEIAFEIKSRQLKQDEIFKQMKALNEELENIQSAKGSLNATLTTNTTGPDNEEP